MNKAGLFQKVSFEQFYRDLLSETITTDREEAYRFYKEIRLPGRFDEGTSLYSIYIPCIVKLKPGVIQRIPTGINAVIKDDWFLACFSGINSSQDVGVRIAGGLQVVESRYRFGENEGHILCSVYSENNRNTVKELYPGDLLCKSAFLSFGVTFDDPWFRK